MDPNPTLDQLQIFLAVVDGGSFSAAARRLGRAQSVVSYGIANLEAQLGLVLFAREGTRQPRLTAAGQAMVPDARRMAAALQLLRARAHGLRGGLEAEVRLAVDVLLPAAVMTAVLKGFRDAYPTVGLQLHTGALGAVQELLQTHRADLGIASAPTAIADTLAVRQLGGATMIPVAAPEHPLAGSAGPVPASLVREHFQVVITDQTAHTKGRDIRVVADAVWRVTDAETKRALLCAGLGWGGLPDWMVAPDLAAGRLVVLALEPYPPSPYRLSALWPAAATPGPAVSWLIDRFEAELAVLAR